MVYLTAAERLNRAEATRRRDILRPTQARKGKIDMSDTPTEYCCEKFSCENSIFLNKTAGLLRHLEEYSLEFEAWPGGPDDGQGLPGEQREKQTPTRHCMY